MNRLTNQTALITGGARGIGAAIAKLFLQEGAAVIITDILREEGELTASALGSHCLFVQHDVTLASAWKQVVSFGEAKFGPITILVNNAGVVLNKGLQQTTLDEFEMILRINTTGPFLGIEALLPSMLRHRKGSIINISSVAGLVGFSNCIAYVTSKFALRGMTKTAALELANSGIRVNSIHPGVIRTPMVMNDSMADLIDQVTADIPMHRIGEPLEIAQLALFLDSDESSYCTGAEFTADGGLTAQ
ncbi:MAG: glucose 1-dehydrogenase [Sphingomonadales bacterium]|nr:glucose 1-dehydrogenase [Sphingomonadales bacterium]